MTRRYTENGIKTGGVRILQDGVHRISGYWVGGARQSMSDTDNCFDNAAAERFFSTIKEELIYRHSWPTKVAVAREIVEYIENFYNLKRRHSTIGRVSPVDYDLNFMRQLAA